VYTGDEEAEPILAERSSMPIGVGGDAEEAGGDVEYMDEGVSGSEPNEGSGAHRWGGILLLV